ncbi:uncharacterized protein PHALS_10849 [Plasmopara halstedii]|uniref:Uncharacterized protein n=1 Tax=Plasmopara halstedii TaxID=4781 RepID=A0A0P1AIE1_PLAHL|nr:uncharacterized protein PHALS_10849 [Plasmopara halstedii]CEG40663.1 hypothetical protein PHALS_10849 [Plasmopara halstedii]|eukprot:XP_024577032.1 hypothetical protein PHALS_10849 [Plasmopara halstedii]
MPCLSRYWLQQTGFIPGECLPSLNLNEQLLSRRCLAISQVVTKFGVEFF